MKAIVRQLVKRNRANGGFFFDDKDMEVTQTILHDVYGDFLVYSTQDEMAMEAVRKYRVIEFNREARVAAGGKSRKFDTLEEATEAAAGWAREAMKAAQAAAE